MLTLNDELWPNGIKKDNEGYAVFYPIGTNKTTIPVDSSDWPTGDKLISPFVFQNDELVGFVDTKAMTVSGNTTTTMPYTHIEADFSSIKEGTLTVNAPNATIKKFKWAVVQNDNGSYDYVIIDFNATDQTTIDAVRSAYRVVDKKMYDVDGNVIGTWDTSKIEVGGIFDEENMMADGVYSNTDYDGELDRGLILTEFNSDLSSLTDGAYMFAACPNFTSFISDLSSLTNGESMFYACINLTSFTSDSNGSPMNLSSLSNGYGMFLGCSNLTSFPSDLSSLTNGEMMFLYCSNLTSFTINLSCLTNGQTMFLYCFNLTSFTSDLSSLIHGVDMFYYCKLDAPSIKNIIDTINTYSGILTLSMGCDNTTEDKDLFAQEVGYTDMASLLAALQAKGWTVTAQYNGRPTSTYSMRRTTEPTLPVFVKLEKVEESSDKLESSHTHTSLDGTKKYRLNWFHETTGSTDGYTQFNSLEEAIEHFNIKPVERN